MILRQQHTNRRLGGFSLFEVAIVVVVMSLVLGGTITVWLTSHTAMSDQMKLNHVNETGRRICNRLATEIMTAYPPTVLPLAITNSEKLQFQPVNGFDGGTGPTLGAQRTIGLQMEVGESDNGQDDNGDGRIDEGYVTLTETGGATVQLVGNVTGLRFNGITNGVSVSVDVAVIDRDGNLIQRTFDRSVSFRN